MFHCKYLVDSLLQLESGLDGLLGRGPLHLGRFGNVLEDDPPAAHVLIVDQLEGVLALLLRVLLEDLSETVSGHVIAGEMGVLLREKIKTKM